MKKSIVVVFVVFVSVVILQSVGCKPDVPPGPQYPVYYYTDSIINPPDIFQIMFNISTFGDRFAFVTFENDAVWKIRKLGDNRVYFSAINDTSTIIIEVSDTLGLKGGTTYSFSSNNNNYPEFNNFFAEFTKLEIDYEGFEPKF